MREHSLVVYTAIFGDIGDRLQPVARFRSPEVAFHAYVDGVSTPTESAEGWELRPAAWEHDADPRLRARRHKLLSHELYPDTPATLWLDGCLTPAQDPRLLVSQYLGDGKPEIYFFRHMQRDCVYQECEACIRLAKDLPGTLRAVAKRYRREGYPYNNGLAETTAVLRANTQRIREFNASWWAELLENSVRDQVSCDYVAWRMSLEYGTFPGTRMTCPHFTWIPHG